MKKDPFNSLSAAPVEFPTLGKPASSKLEDKLEPWRAAARLFVVDGKPEERRKSGCDPMRFVVIDSRPLERECFLCSIGQIDSGIVLTECESVESCLETLPFAPSIDALILCVDRNVLSDSVVHASIRRLVEGAAPIPVVVLSNSDDVAQMFAVLDCGVSGCIPASIGLRATVEAMKLASLGGFLLTSEGLSAWRLRSAKETQAPEDFGPELTSRQADVARLLRRGKANKIIAHELNMSENTVKIHVRNILQKLHVTNRTEAAFRLNAIGAA